MSGCSPSTRRRRHPREGLLDRPWAGRRSLFAYGKPTVFELSASYAFGLVKKSSVHRRQQAHRLRHCRRFFSNVNGKRFAAAEVDVVLRTLALAAEEDERKPITPHRLKVNSKRA